MHFANFRQLAAMALAWAVFLLAFDHHANGTTLRTYLAEVRGGATRPTSISEGDAPRVRLSMPHLCCTGCLDEVRAALKPLGWLGPPRLATEPPSIDDVATNPTESPVAHEIEFEVLDLAKADFAALDRTMRDTGLVPDRMEVYGMGHFRLEVELPHLCCGLCSKAIDEQVQRLLRKETQGRWLDSMTLNHVKKTAVIYARLNAVVDLLEVTRALAQAGFSARSIRILSGPES
jgi:hypothetical protein